MAKRNHNPVEQMKQPSSISSRIRASASALLTDFSTNVSPSSATSALASALGNDGKPLSTSTFGDYSTSASSSRIYSSPCIHNNGKKSDGVDKFGEEGFRTRPIDTGLEQRDVERILSNQDWTWSPHSKWLKKGNKDHIDQIDQIDQTLQESPSWYPIGGRSAVDSKEAYCQSREYNFAAGTWPDKDFDGGAVLSLLSSPNFTTTQTFEDGGSDWAPDHEGKSDHKRSHIKPPNNIDISQTATLNPLHLLPDYNLKEELGTINGVSYSLVSDPENSSTGVPNDSSSALAAMKKPWIDILNSYQDEVWDPSTPSLPFLPGEEVYSKTTIPQGSTTTAGVKLSDQGKCPARRRLAMINRHIDFLGIW